MLHVDDGQLHAYLDGELEGLEPGASARLESHVEECAVCRARLDEASRLRSAAGAILRAADPSALRLREFESFEAPAPLQVREVRNHHRALQRRARALAWAASLVVACGIGWFARDLYFESGGTVASRQMAPREMPPSPTASPAGADFAADQEPPRDEVELAQVQSVDSPASGTFAKAAETPDVRQPAPTTAENPGEPARATARSPSLPVQPAPGIAAAAMADVPSPTTAVRGLAAPAQSGGRVAVARGRVVSQSGGGVPHAQVAVAALNAGTLTRADGSYSLAIPVEHLRPDEPIQLSVRGYGYAPESQSVNLAPGATVTTDFQLRPETIALEGIVLTGPTRRAERSRLTERRPVADAVEAHHHRAVTASGVAPDAEHGRCRVANLRHLRDPSVTVLTGVARSDTVAAPADAVEYVHRPGRAATQPRQIHGQLVEAQRVGGSQAAEVEQGLAESGAREVVIVPWAFDVSCRPAPWQATYRWIPAGDGAFFTVHLRERRHWVEGRPTFDAFLGNASPYTYPSQAAAAARLTPAQYFDLYQALPTWAELRREPHHATAQLRAWEQTNPDLARRYPAGEILEAIRTAGAHLENTPEP